MQQTTWKPWEKKTQNKIEKSTNKNMIKLQEVYRKFYSDEYKILMVFDKYKYLIV